MRRNRPISLILGLALVSWLLPIQGCSTDPTKGYSFNTVFPENVSTIAIPIFENDTYHRDIEFELTDALIKEILSRTPYRVTSAARADSILLGRISTVQLDQLSKSRATGLSEEVVLSVTIDFQWKDLRSDALLLERQAFAGHGLFVPSTPTGEPIELAQFNAVQQLARDVVGEMRSNW